MGALAMARDSVQCRKEMIDALENASTAWTELIKIAGRYAEDPEVEAADAERIVELRTEAGKWKVDAVECFRRMVENAAAGLVLDSLVEIERRVLKEWKEVVIADGSSF